MSGDLEGRDCAWVIEGGEILTPGGLVGGEDLGLADGRIAGLGTSPVGARHFDAAGFLVLPGIVDLHGDAFERQRMPRPGVTFPWRLALADTDRQLLSNGVTTAFHGLTWSWEPGLRGSEAARGFARALEGIKSDLACDTRLHLRFETHNLEAVAEAEEWIKAGRVDLLAFNDHTEYTNKASKYPHRAKTLIERTGLTLEQYLEKLNEIMGRREEVPKACARLARAAQGRTALASHDDETPAMRDFYRGLGCALAEFPTNRETAQAAILAGDAVIMGSPNVVRGGSHFKSGLDAAQAASEGLCTVLASDYYYPAMLQAPFILVDKGLLPLDKAWDLVSANPARAAGLMDRGRLEPGRRADLIVVERVAGQAEVRAVFSAGRLVLAGAQAMARIRALGC